ncbi:putative membrane protein [Bacillus ectoiniformans]|uniref:YidH family protein n=1 Tax=Bacillus ectoiniformans TaxID=1494429 RepID=UPI00195622F4|nr:DUF202 domain-containing protein [Bacillus ectoiniformans]MBM7649227.1 putative membrane protein [Bacillus ectoiniformans]
MDKDKEHQTTTDSKYIQQHLANERTYLAWVRTAIAIIGVGFLITNLHFTMRTSFGKAGDWLANTIGMISVITGIAAILLSTFSYLRKRDDINNQCFRSPARLVWGLSILLILIILVFAVYVFSITI